MLTCYRCGKPIQGQAVLTNPPMISIQLGCDFPKSFHPRCHEAVERAAAKMLGLPYISSVQS